MRVLEVLVEGADLFFVEGGGVGCGGVGEREHGEFDLFGDCEDLRSREGGAWDETVVEEADAVGAGGFRAEFGAVEFVEFPSAFI